MEKCKIFIDKIVTQNKRSFANWFGYKNFVIFTFQTYQSSRSFDAWLFWWFERWNEVFWNKTETEDGSLII